MPNLVYPALIMFDSKFVLLTGGTICIIVRCSIIACGPTHLDALETPSKALCGSFQAYVTVLGTLRNWYIAISA